MKEIAQAILHGAIVITTGGFSESLRLVYPKVKTVDAYLFKGQILMYGEQYYVIDKRFADRVDMNTYDDASFCCFNQNEEGLILKHLRELIEVDRQDAILDTPVSEVVKSVHDLNRSMMPLMEVLLLFSEMASKIDEQVL